MYTILAKVQGSGIRERNVITDEKKIDKKIDRLDNEKENDIKQALKKGNIVEIIEDTSK